jgi:outer membrane receptor protein involved in Fe transport
MNTGKIVGFVADSSGAAVMGATVRATEDGTGVATQTITAQDGEYLLNFLEPGTYTVEIEKAGFQKSVTKLKVVVAGGSARVQVTLKVGKATDVVQVTANPIEVATETSELSQTFGAKELDSLPNIDRNPLYQLNLMPGANNDDGSGNYGSNGNENGSAVGQTRPQLASIGGVDANANSVYIEGVFNREPQNAYIGITPPIEGIEEVQVFTGKYNAEYGFSGSAVINIVSKAGTNKYHGSLFEFLRNNATDAKNYFATDTTPFQRNQFGGAVGGPIRKDKFFFFADYEGTQFHVSTPEYTSAPTPKMITGDFSELYDPTQPNDTAGNTYGQLYDPFTRTFDPGTGTVTGATPYPHNLIPQSEWDAAATKMNTGTVFGVANLPGISNNLYYLGTVRQSVNQGDARLDYALSERNRTFFRYSILNSTTDNSTNVNQFFQDGNTDSLTWNQNMQFSDLFTLSATKMNELRLGFSRSNVHTSNKSLGADWNNTFGIPNGNLGDAITRGLAEFAIPGVHGVAEPDWVGYIYSNTISGVENFIWIHGSHTVKVGTNLNHVQDVSADTIGGDDPRGSLTFDPAMTSYDGLNTAPYGYPSFLLGTMVGSARARFVQGAPFQSYWQNAWYAQDDYKILRSLTLNLGLRYELVTRPIARNNRESNWDTATENIVVATSKNRSPGLNLDKGSWGPRLGLAWSPDNGKTSVRAGYGVSYWMAYWSGPLTVLGLTYPNYAKAALLTPDSLIPTLQLSKDGIPIPTAVYDGSGNLVIPDNAVIRGVEPNWRAQSVDQKTLNVEREIRPGMIVDIGYMGVRGRHNLHSLNINQAPPSANQNNDYQTSRPLYSLYPTLGDVPISVSRADSYYNALTARFAANVGHDLYVNASYAHGRSFADGNNLDQTNIRQYYGPTQQDIAHIFNAQASYALPVGRGKAWINHSNRLVDALIGGWQYSALLHMRSGVRFDVTSGASTLNNGQTNRPDRTGSGKLSHPTIAQWFDTSAFVDHEQEGTYGNSGINPLHGDDQIQLDSSLEKKFALVEGAQLEFRVDAFNTFNHPDFGTPDSFVGDGGEGQITSTSVDNRRLQLSLRLSF